MVLVCRLCQNIMCDGGSCQEYRGIMVNGRPDNMTHAGRIIWHRWPFWMTICKQHLILHFSCLAVAGKVGIYHEHSKLFSHITLNGNGLLFSSTLPVVPSKLQSSRPSVRISLLLVKRTEFLPSSEKYLKVQSLKKKCL